MPGAGSVAVVDTVTWKVSARLKVAGRPGRIRLQADERYLWVASDEEVVAFDPATLKPARRIPATRGPHELALSADSRWLFVTNREGGSVTVIDTGATGEAAEVPLGARPSSVTFSALSRLAYVASEDGIAAIDTRGEVVARMAAETGIRQLRAAPGGRFIFAVNPDKDQLHIVDTSANRIVQTSIIHGGPDQVTYTNTLAYIRRRSDATVLMIPLDKVGVAGASLPLVDFTGGHLPFSKGALSSTADSIVPVPGSNAVLVANPADRAVYYYQEGMAAPMGQFSNYSHEPRSVLVVDRGLEEEPKGTYQTTGRVPQAGIYDVVFFLDSPRVVHCFELAVKPAEGEPAGPRSVMIRSVPAEREDGTIGTGELSRVRFQVLDARTQQPIPNLHDLRALVFLQPGIWQTRSLAAESAPSIYEFRFTPPSSGIYQTYFESPSLGLTFNSPHALTLVARSGLRAASDSK
jgi:YVTN family beta-propeller protein